MSASCVRSGLLAWPRLKLLCLGLLLPKFPTPDGFGLRVKGFRWGLEDLGSYVHRD